MLRVSSCDIAILCKKCFFKLYFGFSIKWCNQVITLLSPARRGRGILVVPGFCPASSIRRHVLLWTQKLLVNFFWNFTMTFLATWGCARDFLKMLPKFKMATRGQLNSNFAITFPMIWRCACDFFKVLWKFKMAAMHELHNFLWAQKLKNWSQK